MDADATRRIFRRHDAIFLGYLASAPEIHSHHAIQCSIALDGKLRFAGNSGGTVRIPSVLIGPDEPHILSASGLVAHFYIDPESSTGASLCSLLAGRTYCEVERRLPSGARDALSRSWEDEDLLEPCFALLLSALVHGSPQGHSIDSRVAKAIQVLNEEESSPRLPELSRRVGLSPDRLRHLFKQETGLTLRQYTRWIRLVRSLHALRRGSSITDAAARAGFADSAHLSRVFRESFCCSPRAMMQDSRFVQVLPSKAK